MVSLSAFDPKGENDRANGACHAYVAYVLRREGEAAVADLGEADDIDNLVTLPGVLRDPTSSSYREMATTLFGG